ncbi:MAG: hypothetical protein VSS75_005815 [Candidatus Parabeggiatoa sp.]|nr:hypothetical protein [Candidatus Parabeggiatoa sp.]
MPKMNAIVLMIGLIMSYPVFAQDMLIYLDIESPNAEGVLTYLPENISLPVRGTEPDDKLTRPWFPALPILGNYTLAEVNDLPQFGPVIRLEAQTGKGKLLQRLGKGGLVLLSDLNASGLWRSKANTPLNSFGVLSVIDKAAFSQLASQFRIGIPVAIQSLAEKNKVRWFHQESVDYWLSSKGLLVPVPPYFVTTEKLEKAIVLESETAQVLTLEIQESFVGLKKPDSLQNLPFPPIHKVNITIWRISETGSTEFVSRAETNTNAPFIFQKTIPKRLKRGDKMVILCTEHLDLELEATLEISELLSQAQTALPDSFTLLKLKAWLNQQTANPLMTQLIISRLIEQALRPIKIIDENIEWTWHSDSNEMKLDGLFYPLLRVFVYAL